MGLEKKPNEPRGQTIGRSRGGPTTKIHLACDAKGRPINFRLSGGNVHDARVAPWLLRDVPGTADHTIADKGYDSDPLREQIRDLGSRPVFPGRSNRKIQRRCRPKILYLERHRAENKFCDLKQYRAVATRYDKLARNYAGMVAMACVIQWLKD